MIEKRPKRYFKAKALFAASNSANGFKSYYDQIFDREKLSRVYIIKGGPGTGKSKFMRDVADIAESKGYYVEYYNCSSDPDSLDGIIIDDKVALLDGTAPHTAEPDIPGARDEIVSLGAFWDSGRLCEKYPEIKSLDAKKKDCYSKGYRYLSGCGELLDINKKIIFSAIKEGKMKNCISRLLSSLPAGNGFSIVPAITDSVGMKGRVKFDTYEKCAERLYCVIDYYSTAHIFLSALITEAQRNDIPLRVSYDPIDPSRPDGVYFCNSGVAFTAAEPNDMGDEAVNKINMKRFLDKKVIDAVKKEYRYNLKLYEALLSSACDAFAQAGEYHFELEKIYASAMDFAAKERFTASFCEMLFEFLK